MQIFGFDYDLKTIAFAVAVGIGGLAFLRFLWWVGYVVLCGGR